MINTYQTNNGQFFALHTENTTYAFKTIPTGQLEHLYYGEKIRLDADTAEGLSEHASFSPGNSISYDNEHPEVCLDDLCLEYSSYGKGDFREPMIMLSAGKNPALALDFIFEGAELFSKDGKNTEGSAVNGEQGDEDKNSNDLTLAKTRSATLPLSYGWDNYLIVGLKEKEGVVRLYLHFAVYEKANVITRRCVLWNISKEEVRIKKLMSLQLDFDRSYYDKKQVFTSFNGAWTREMERHDSPVVAGTLSNRSMTGSSSNYANPFVMLHPENTSENMGEVYGFNLVYSGNHLEQISVSPYKKLRFLSGINPESGYARLAPGEKFEAPEAVMSFSVNGFNGLSRNMHRFVNEHIIRGSWKKKDRPLLLNSWEAAYFDINESRLVKLAKKAAESGIELFVMDDGWFGKRDNDKTSLGDWKVNKSKLPNGLLGLSDKIHGLGLKFGLWVEPEMVNTESELYWLHPDWALEVPDRNHSEGRNQRLLNLSKPEVRDYLFTALSAVFKEGKVDYVKWDYNRNYSDYPLEVRNTALSAVPVQLATNHACILGLYELMRRLVKAFPDILFEGCASGGNRFDLGILSFFPQIWASDDTDPVMRADIQNGYSYGYPQSAYTGHVSSAPNHQTLRATPLDTRFNVAAFTVSGYELNLCDMKADDIKIMAAQTAFYKKYRHVLQYGDFYRIRHDNVTEWIVVSEDKKTAIGLHLLEQTRANERSGKFVAAGLLPDAKYRVSIAEKPIDIKVFGDLINTMAPVHIKQDSLMHNMAAKFVKMSTEARSFTAYGDSLMNAGMRLNAAYSGTGVDGKTRLATDYSSEIYVIEAVEA